MRPLALVLPAAALLTPSIASASTTDSHVTNIYVNQDGFVAFDIADAKPQHPSCSPVSNNFVFRLNSVAGQSMLAVLLTAKSTDKAITVFGGDSCTVDGSAEDMTAVIIRS